MSESTLSSGTRHVRRSRRSILSSGSDIRFTRKKLTSQYKCGCIIIAAFLVLLLLAGAAVYIGFNYFSIEFPGPQIYRGTFKIIDGDVFTAELADPSSKNFRTRSRDYRERLNLLFRRSIIRQGFLGTEILALDGTENKDLVIHFILNVDPTYTKVNAKDLEAIIEDDVELDDPILFRNIKIEPNSLLIQLNSELPENASSTTIVFEAITQASEPPKQCVHITLPYCSKLSYNVTSFPNMFNHRNVREVENNIIPFRELVDAECYNHTYEFICNVLQPFCVKENVNILPCKSFCKYFMSGCGSRLPEKLREMLDCNKFLEYEEDNCFIEPDCGIQKSQGAKILSKTANPGDWPWHVTLLKENVHICDGTLISPNWVATTSSCFQGQPQAEWLAKFGVVNLTATSSYEQERRIVGMVKSPVEGSTIALIKLDASINLSEYVRPICLPKRHIEMSATSECNTLGWTKDREHLKRIQVKVTRMEKCENISISNLNSVCAEIAYGQENCHEDEYAGSPVMCIDRHTQTWSIVGVTNWRISCSKNGMERPRMYDKISSNINWLHETINSDV